jgi:hypothetical protein
MSTNLESAKAKAPAPAPTPAEVKAPVPAEVKAPVPATVKAPAPAVKAAVVPPPPPPDDDEDDGFGDAAQDADELVKALKIGSLNLNDFDNSTTRANHFTYLVKYLFNPNSTKDLGMDTFFTELPSYKSNFKIHKEGTQPTGTTTSLKLNTGQLSYIKNYNYNNDYLKFKKLFSENMPELSVAELKKLYEDDENYFKEKETKCKSIGSSTPSFNNATVNGKSDVYTFNGMNICNFSDEKFINDTEFSELTKKGFFRDVKQDEIHQCCINVKQLLTQNLVKHAIDDITTFTETMTLSEEDQRDLLNKIPGIDKDDGLKKSLIESSLSTIKEMFCTSFSLLYNSESCSSSTTQMGGGNNEDNYIINHLIELTQKKYFKKLKNLKKNYSGKDPLIDKLKKDFERDQMEIKSIFNFSKKQMSFIEKKTEDFLKEHSTGLKFDKNMIKFFSGGVNFQVGGGENDTNMFNNFGYAKNIADTLKMVCGDGRGWGEYLSTTWTKAKSPESANANEVKKSDEKQAEYKKCRDLYTKVKSEYRTELEEKCKSDPTFLKTGSNYAECRKTLDNVKSEEKIINIAGIKAREQLMIESLNRDASMTEEERAKSIEKIKSDAKKRIAEILFPSASELASQAAYDISQIAKRGVGVVFGKGNIVQRMYSQMVEKIEENIGNYIYTSDDTMIKLNDERKKNGFLSIANLKRILFGTSDAFFKSFFYILRNPRTLKIVAFLFQRIMKKICFTFFKSMNIVNFSKLPKSVLEGNLNDLAAYTMGVCKDFTALFGHESSGTFGVAQAAAQTVPFFGTAPTLVLAACAFYSQDFLESWLESLIILDGLSELYKVVDACLYDVWDDVDLQIWAIYKTSTNAELINQIIKTMTNGFHEGDRLNPLYYGVKDPESSKFMLSITRYDLNDAVEKIVNGQLNFAGFYGDMDKVPWVFVKWKTKHGTEEKAFESVVGPDEKKTTTVGSTVLTTVSDVAESYFNFKSTMVGSLDLSKEFIHDKTNLLEAARLSIWNAISVKWWEMRTNKEFIEYAEKKNFQIDTSTKKQVITEVAKWSFETNKDKAEAAFDADRDRANTEFAFMSGGGNLNIGTTRQRVKLNFTKKKFNKGSKLSKKI